MPAAFGDLAAPSAADPLASFSEPTRAWFTSSFAEPTPVQVQAWSAIARGQCSLRGPAAVGGESLGNEPVPGSVLVSAPTGSGKTLAALDRLFTAPAPEPAVTRVLYVSPLKSLAYDVDRNLRAPLVGIRRAAERLGQGVPEVAVGMRTGDTPAEERRRLRRHSPDILITTPESLFLLLTSRAREPLAGVGTVIVDEVHAVAGTKRGAHLALSLERLEALVRSRGHAGLQRIGLSATQRPLEEVAAFLAGGTVGAGGTWGRRPVEIVDLSAGKRLDVEIVVPVEDMGQLGELIDEPPSGPAAGPGESRRSIWPAVHPRLLDLVLSHSSTIVFVNSRRLAERLCARLNELAAEAGHAEPITRAHHGSVAREQRVQIESELKAGRGGRAAHARGADRGDPLSA